MKRFQIVGILSGVTMGVLRKDFKLFKESYDKAKKLSVEYKIFN
jgi:hypothetical protein